MTACAVRILCGHEYSELDGGGFILGWGGVAYSMLRIAALVPPAVLFRVAAFSSSCEVEDAKRDETTPELK
jgi:hypothetical protein